MDCEECNAPMTRKSRQNYIEDHWDKSGAVALYGIETDVCPSCGIICPVIPKLGPLADLSRQYPGARQFWYQNDAWMIPEWMKEWKLKTDLQVGDMVVVEGEHWRLEPLKVGEVVGVEVNQYDYDILRIKYDDSPEYMCASAVNHNRCRKMGEENLSDS